MLRNTCRIAALGLILAAHGISAHAHNVYPPGCGGWGWGGWVSSTVQGEAARGLGVLAQGVGEGRGQTAHARGLNAETAALDRVHAPCAA